ncbi:uncharacterized protein VTP21DRAFT_1081 [Calcarisporiella thermophila]|uniref:uncharacterized protein n=1 Tax=Calcarisporiella thermophila TaxID=911321 RepID=UPI0037436930
MRKMIGILSDKNHTGGCGILALAGLGGMGKTQLMLRYCYLCHEANEFVFWLNVNSWTTTLDSFRKLASYLGIGENLLNNESEENVMCWVRCWLEAREGWLLLLDDLDDSISTKIFKILSRKGGHIILTTRGPISTKLAIIIQVDRMLEEEAISLLLENEVSIDRHSARYYNARRIVAELDYMPLAIDLARAYITNSTYPFQDYLRQLKKNRPLLFSYRDERSVDDYKHTVATVWELTFDRLRKLNPATGVILEACAFLHSEGIPTRFFERLFSIFELGSESLEQDKFRSAIGDLSKFSFISVTVKEADENEIELMSNSTLSIRRLVQRIIFDSIPYKKKLSWIQKMAVALNRETQFPEFFDISAWSAMRVYLPRINHLVAVVLELNSEEAYFACEDLIALLNTTTSYMHENGTLQDTEKLAQLALTMSEIVYGLDHITTSQSLHAMATLYYAQAKYELAEPLYQRTLKLRETILGPEHPETADSLSGLSNLYRLQLRYDQAEPLYLRALTIREKALGSEHPYTATLLNDFAGLFHDQGKYEQAEPRYLRALAIRERKLGEDHPDTATSLNDLANLYQHQCKYDQAGPLYQRALVVRERVLGENHRDTGMTLNNLADFYRNQGENQERVLGPEHLDIAASLNNLATLYHDQGKYEQAEPLYKRALVIIEKELGAVHPYTATSLNNLATFHFDQGKYESAEALYQRVLAIQEKLLGAYHPDTASSIIKLAVLYDHLGKSYRAEPLYQRANAIKEKQLKATAHFESF